MKEFVFSQLQFVVLILVIFFDSKHFHKDQKFNQQCVTSLCDDHLVYSIYFKYKFDNSRYIEDNFSFIKNQQNKNQETSRLKNKVGMKRNSQ